MEEDIIGYTEEEFEEVLKKLITEATEKNDPTAQAKLGIYYLNSMHIENHEKEAVKWLRLAAENGDFESMSLVADYYEEEEGYENAMEWYKKIVDTGYYYAYTYLGRLYKEGRGVPQDERKAFEYFKKAADKGYPDGMCELIECYIHGIGTEKNIEKAKEYKDKIERGEFVNANDEDIDYFSGEAEISFALFCSKRFKSLGG